MLQLLFDKSERDLRKYKEYVKKINFLESTYSNFSDSQLKYKTSTFKELLKNKQANLDSLLIEAFAVVREVTKRCLNLRIFDVQLIGGIALHYGKISEMRTGEGKTLCAALPAYLNALTGESVHIVTVNDYLARRDYEQLKPIFISLGLSVGLIQEGMGTQERKRNYSCDITYVTNSQLGFDYLRENMATTIEQIVHRPFSYCIVDEIDSILIDEARTPLIISGPGAEPSTRYSMANQLAIELIEGRDYEVDKKNYNITLTEQGLLFCEKYLEVNDIYDIYNPWASYILNALKAHKLYIRDRSYIVKDEEIIIVDENTGRIMIGRRWSDGLHQAIEAKENVRIQGETKTLASITYQNFFLLYKKLSGMTGTAKTEEIEFEKIYSLEVQVVPTNKPMIRKDYPDLIYKNQASKWKAVANECYDMFHIGRPILVGTTSVEQSELLSSLLQEYKIPHNLLNAKPENTIREAEIIAQAGRLSAITIATNMAGRGTDIILGGNPDYIVKSLIKNLLEWDHINQVKINNLLKSLSLYNINSIISEKITQLFHYIESNKLNLQDLELLTNLKQSVSFVEPNQTLLKYSLQELYDHIYNYINESTEEEKKAVLKLGGLYVIGTERHASRRIDNQLRGRTGRQGDPGQSRFFISLDDSLFQRFPVEKLKSILNTLQLDDDIPIESPLLMSTLEGSQKKIESYYFDQRKNIFEYDQVLNKQRQAIYAERREILETKNLDLFILVYGQTVIYDLIDAYVTNPNKSMRNIDLFLWCMQNLLGLSLQLSSDDVKAMPNDLIYYYFYQQFILSYKIKEIYLEFVIPEATLELERFYLLSQIDNAWTEHLQKMASLMDSVGWRAYGQEDPLIEYKSDAFKLFIIMTINIRQSVIYSLLGLNLALN
uniref:preprotein translocase subunit SecA n=1 Tax=Porphyridium aerugineum TaxID=2792 RepID=UPI001FCDFD4F|nr:preprotein translocase subunit SecA [Porphyridium aerugineum]UNJ17853.1 preprotein translocase subunit SecA [Porphyridium aerugineum]